MRWIVAGGRGRLAVAPGGDLVGERAQLGVADRERVVRGAPQPLAVLQQVGAVGLERVARQAALELQVGEEVEQQVLERLGACGGGVAMAMDCMASPPGGRAPARCNGAFSGQAVAQEQQADQRLRVLDLGDQRVELGERRGARS